MRPGALQAHARQAREDFRSLKEAAMKRLHVHVAVGDLSRAIGFYSALFDTRPSVVKPDYAKWMLEDPRVNFAISTRGRQPGLDHLGIQVESSDELQEVYGRLRNAGNDVIEQGRRPAAMRSRKSPGSMIRRASRGRRSSRPARSPTTATAAGSAMRAWRIKRRAVISGRSHKFSVSPSS